MEEAILAGKPEKLHVGKLLFIPTSEWFAVLLLDKVKSLPTLIARFDGYDPGAVAHDSFRIGGSWLRTDLRRPHIVQDFEDCQLVPGEA